MNKTLLLIGGGIAACVLMVCLVLGIYMIGTYNEAAKLKNTYEAKVKDNSSEFDNMWKKIQQVSQVTDAQKNALREIFEGYAQARTGNGSGGNLVKWIHESVPNVDTSTFNNLQNLIVSSRDAWTMRQKELVDISRQYNQNLAVFPSKLVLGMFGFEKIDPKVITSSKTEKTFETGKDDDVALPLNQK
jgi:hypothetical protein